MTKVAKVVFWLGPSIERWDPVTAIERGIGGSETAAIHVSRELERLGHDVEVYADIEGQVCIAGVDWWPYGKLPAHSSCDLFVSSRQPEARRNLLLNCRKAWLWVHDVHCGPDWDNVLGIDYDRILCLSEWARARFLEYYPAVDSSRVATTWNGLDGELFENVRGTIRTGYCEVPNVRLLPADQHSRFWSGIAPLRATFSSSPDRGLDKLLDLWPLICEIGREVCPENRLLPELHVYYGFETWRRVAEKHGDVTATCKIALLEEKLARTPGVHYHGREGQVDVARSHLQSQLWLYPTNFVETSCITAMEAQAAGCQVVATCLGALPETAPAGRFADGPTSRPGYDEQFLSLVRKALLEGAPRKYAPRTWASVARQWDAWMRKGI